MNEDAAFPRTVTTRGELRDVKRPACFSVADRRVSKLRPSLSVSRAAGMSSRSGRQMHSDRLAEDEAQKALHPQSPAGEAINSNRQPNVQREKDLRQTPTAGRGPRTKDQCQLRRFDPCWLRRTNVNSALPAIPSWATGQESESSVRSDPGSGITPPGFYGWKPWRKPNSASIITASKARR